MTRLIALVFATLLFLTACSSGTTTTTSSTAEAGATSGTSATTATPAGPTITITDFKFGPPLTVTHGAKVTVVNSDGAEHTVTADSGNAFNVEVDGKGTTSFTAPTQAGTYAYHCNYHPMMHGQLIVQ
ncbi:MAG TPA: cupredoxin domain-containing protein [Mycobacterium sp.]|nr:cupredoxin domain-containing protein [Mycobacterium sp.]